MVGIFTIPQIVSFSQVSLYLASNDQAAASALKSGSIATIQPALLYVEGSLLQSMYALNPNGSTIRKTGEYVLSLCGKYLSQAKNILNNLLQNPPIIAGPSNQSVGVGASATFTITVTSTLAYTVQWFSSDGNPIIGQTGLTYILTNAQLADSGKTFYAKATNAAGTTTSATASLTVTMAIIGYYYQGGTDYSTSLLSGTDNVSYLGTFSITSGQPLNVTFPHLVSTEYIVVKYPATETTKTNFLNPPPSGPDSGPIPSLALEGNSFGGWKYIFSRTGNTMGVNSVNGTIRFS